MEIMELSSKMESMNLMKMPPVLHSVLNGSLPSQNLSPRVTRSRVTTTTQSKEIPSAEIALPSASRRPRKKKNDQENDIEKFYLNKKVTLIHKTLETIYEDPILKKGNTMFIGQAKVKRSLYLDREFRITSKQKSKLRKTKIKRLGRQAKKCKISDEEFKKKLNSIESFINEEDNEQGSSVNEPYNAAVNIEDNSENVIEIENNVDEIQTDMIGIQNDVIKIESNGIGIQNDVINEEDEEVDCEDKEELPLHE